MGSLSLVDEKEPHSKPDKLMEAHMVASQTQQPK